MFNASKTTVKVKLTLDKKCPIFLTVLRMRTFVTFPTFSLVHPNFDHLLIYVLNVSIFNISLFLGGLRLPPILHFPIAVYLTINISESFEMFRSKPSSTRQDFSKNKRGARGQRENVKGEIKVSDAVGFSVSQFPIFFPLFAMFFELNFSAFFQQNFQHVIYQIFRFFVCFVHNLLDFFFFKFFILLKYFMFCPMSFPHGTS